MKKYYCKYCNKEFDDFRKLGQHVIHCDLNPNKELQLTNLRKSLSNKSERKKCSK